MATEQCYEGARRGGVPARQYLPTATVCEGRVMYAKSMHWSEDNAMLAALPEREQIFGKSPWVLRFYSEGGRWYLNKQGILPIYSLYFMNDFLESKRSKFSLNRLIYINNYVWVCCNTTWCCRRKVVPGCLLTVGLQFAHICFCWKTYL